jgi:hypothetical protein
VKEEKGQETEVAQIKFSKIFSKMFHIQLIKIQVLTQEKIHTKANQ